MKLLIIDDEATIRKGLRETIDWETLQIEVVGDVSNGIEAMGILRKTHVDLVITDIRMPLMDGLELVKAMEAEGISSEVIIISGYDDFDYAQKAIKMGVQDYLLKPVDIDELLLIVKKSQLEFKNKRQDALLKWFLHDILNISEEGYFSGTILHISEGKPFRILCSQLSDFYMLYESCSDDQLKLVGQQWKQCLESFFWQSNLEHTSVFVHQNLLVSILVDEQQIPDGEISSVVTNLVHSWSGPQRLRLAISDLYHDLKDLKKAYLQALSIMDAPIVQSKSDLPPSYSHKQIERLRHIINEQNPDALQMFMDQLFAEFEHKGYRLSEVVMVCHKIVIVLDQRFAESGVHVLKQLHFRSAPDVYTYNAYEPLKRLFSEDMNHFREHVDKVSSGNKYHLMMEKAKAYIEKHLYQDIRASEIAEWLHVTPNYFSQIFNQEIGKSFNEYLNILRVEKAKVLLLSTNDKVFEIAEKVGYKDYKHFAYVFKNITGVTPSILRGNNLMESLDADESEGEL
jgi:two-component system response regulator YesN